MNSIFAPARHVQPSPRSRQWNGFTTERIRRPIAGVDRGLYVVRTPDRVSRIAVVRGFETRHHAVPHRVHTLINGQQLGPVLAQYWSSKRRLPDLITYVDAVGCFNAAVHFACRQARAHAVGAMILTFTKSTTP